MGAATGSPCCWRPSSDLALLMVATAGLLVLHRWSKIYFVLWWLVSSVIWVNLFLALILEVSETTPSRAVFHGVF